MDRGDKFLLYKMKFRFGEKGMFLIADPKDIKDGKMTDVYFVRTMEVRSEEHTSELQSR